MKRRLPWIIASLVGLVVLIVAILWSQLGKPAEGQVHNHSSVASSPKTPTWTKLNGRQFSMDILSDYVLKPQAETPTGTDNYFYIEDGSVTKHLAVAVADMNGHGLTEEPAYQMRQLAPETYKLEMRSLAGRTIPVMVRLDHTEQAAFIVKGDKLATIALITGDPANPPVEEFNHMISSWTWK